MRWRRPLLVAMTAVLAVIALDQIFPPDLTRYRDRSVEILDAANEPLNVALSQDGKWRLATSVDQVDPGYLRMLIATEDHRYWWHPGVDPLALVRAAWQLITNGHVVSGGSTLTMQTARLLTPHHRGVPGKLIDIARALQLEAHYSKRQILDLYLTLAPFGGNLEGVRAASLSYFGTEPTVLTAAQSALLVALPQRPTQLRPDRFPEGARAALMRVAGRSRDNDPQLSEDSTARGPLARRSMPAMAPHLAERLHSAGLTEPVYTTIDVGLQRKLEAFAAREAERLRPSASLAALVVRNSDRAVIAYLGGPDFFGPIGMVDMVRARRSPGSSLKPFIYGLAFDAAIIAPGSLIADRAMRLGTYAPRNFDGEFHGTVTATEALQQSYNLPAVALLERLGPERFAESLRQAGATLALPRGTEVATLPIALGGVGISLEDLVALYAAIPNGGKAAHLRFQSAEPLRATAPLFTEESASHISTILAGAQRPDGVSPARNRTIAYKTGTSYGFRDAWSIGYSDAYTIGVWVGRVDGTPRPGETGREAAAPILFQIFDMLPDERPETKRAPLRSVADTPRGLREFVPASATSRISGNSPEIVFPPSGAVLEVSSSASEAAPIDLEAAGGEPPYLWVIDGRPLPPSPTGTHTAWTPNGIGFVQISVTDRNHESSTVEIRLQ